MIMMPESGADTSVSFRAERGTFNQVTAIATKFDIERFCVQHLMHRLGCVVKQYEKPNADGVEHGVDVVALVGRRRIGIQATVLDTGTRPGVETAAERAAARNSPLSSGVYARYAPNPTVDPIIRAIQKKANIGVDTSSFDESWLLVSANIPEHGRLVSTMIMPEWIDVSRLTDATSDMLLKTAHTRAYVHPIVHSGKALFEWTREHGVWTRHAT